jgi:hypothetical protein
MIDMIFVYFRTPKMFNKVKVSRKRKTNILRPEGVAEVKRTRAVMSFEYEYINHYLESGFIVLFKVF